MVRRLTQSETGNITGVRRKHLWIYTPSVLIWERQFFIWLE